MDILLNNNKEHFDQDKLSINEILAVKGFKFRMLVVRINNVPVKKEDFPTTFVFEGDDLKIIHLISGG